MKINDNIIISHKQLWQANSKCLIHFLLKATTKKYNINRHVTVQTNFQRKTHNNRIFLKMMENLSVLVWD